MLLGSSIPGWCWGLQLKRLPEHCWGSGQGSLGSEDLGAVWTCRCHSQEAQCIGGAVGDAEVAFQRCEEPAVPSFQVPWMFGCLHRAWAELGGGQKLRGKGCMGTLGLRGAGPMPHSWHRPHHFPPPAELRGPSHPWFLLFWLS